MVLFLAGENAMKRGCYKEDIVQNPGISTESSSRKSQSISSDQTESRADNLCNKVQFKGEENTIINQL